MKHSFRDGRHIVTIVVKYDDGEFPIHRPGDKTDEYVISQLIQQLTERCHCLDVPPSPSPSADTVIILPGAIDEPPNE